MKRRTSAVGEFYHVYNRGTDKRNIFSDNLDTLRFLQSIIEFNSLEPIGSIYEQKHSKNNRIKITERKSIVEIIAYCLNPNHYHFIFTPSIDGGIEKYMQRIGNGYTKYFNNRHRRSGVLFQGKYKVSHIESNERFLELSAYVNLNNRIHKFGHRMSKFVKSSWNEYIGDGVEGICAKNMVLKQFSNKNNYKKFAEDVVKEIIAMRGDADDSELNPEFGHRMSKF